MEHPHIFMETFSERDQMVFSPGECLFNYTTIMKIKRWQFCFILMSTENDANRAWEVGEVMKQKASNERAKKTEICLITLSKIIPFFTFV